MQLAADLGIVSAADVILSIEMCISGAAFPCLMVSAFGGRCCGCSLRIATSASMDAVAYCWPSSILQPLLISPSLTCSLARRSMRSSCIGLFGLAALAIFLACLSFASIKSYSHSHSSHMWSLLSISRPADLPPRLVCPMTAIGKILSKTTHGNGSFGYSVTQCIICPNASLKSARDEYGTGLRICFGVGLRHSSTFCPHSFRA